MNKTFLKGLFFGILIVASVSLFGDTMYKKILDTVEVHESHKEQKIVSYARNTKNTDIAIPYGWHVVSMTGPGDSMYIYVVLEKN